MHTFELAKKYYPKLWSKDRLRALVELNQIDPTWGLTAEQYEEITGKKYE